MKFDIEILILLCLALFVTVLAWEMLLCLSGGRLRRIETKDKELAHRMEGLVEKRKPMEFLFRTLVFLVLALFSVWVALLIMPLFLHMPRHAVCLAAALAGMILTVLADLFAVFLLLRAELFILRIMTPFLRLLSCTVFYPLISLLGSLQSKAMNIPPEEEEKTTMEDEILSLVEAGAPEEAGALPEEEKRMIRGIFDLDNTIVSEIMTPRVDIIGLPSNSSVSEAKLECVRSGHSRLPLYHGTIDEIKGIILAKDLLDEKLTASKSILELAHKPLFIPESKTVRDLLDDLKRSGTHLAVIIDEYGGTAGIITIEDIVEQIVGDIRDEYDSDEDTTPKPVPQPDGSFIFDGRALISEVNDLLGVEISENEDANTIGGFVCAELGRIPESGELCLLPGQLSATIIKADRKKIISLKLKPEGSKTNV